jgi:hypothetical protein
MADRFQTRLEHQRPTCAMASAAVNNFTSINRMNRIKVLLAYSLEERGNPGWRPSGSPLHFGNS